jgi:hypothetical protein
MLPRLGLNVASIPSRPIRTCPSGDLDRFGEVAAASPDILEFISVHWINSEPQRPFTVCRLLPRVHLKHRILEGEHRPPCAHAGKSGEKPESRCSCKGDQLRKICVGICAGVARKAHRSEKRNISRFCTLAEHSTAVGSSSLWKAFLSDQGNKGRVSEKGFACSGCFGNFLWDCIRSRPYAACTCGLRRTSGGCLQLDRMLRRRQWRWVLGA